MADHYTRIPIEELDQMQTRLLNLIHQRNALSEQVKQLTDANQALRAKLAATDGHVSE